MKLEIKKSNLNDGVDVYKFLCDLGIEENGFHMTPPSDKIEFKELLKNLKYIKHIKLYQFLENLHLLQIFHDDEDN